MSEGIKYVIHYGLSCSRPQVFGHVVDAVKVETHAIAERPDLVCMFCGHPPGNGAHKCLNCGAPKRAA